MLKSKLESSSEGLDVANGTLCQAGVYHQCNTAVDGLIYPGSQCDASRLTRFATCNKQAHACWKCNPVPLSDWSANHSACLTSLAASCDSCRCQSVRQHKPTAQEQSSSTRSHSQQACHDQESAIMAWIISKPLAVHICCRHDMRECTPYSWQPLPAKPWLSRGARCWLYSLCWPLGPSRVQSATRSRIQ